MQIQIQSIWVLLLDHCLLTVNLEHITLLMHFICSVYVYVCAILYCSDANLHLGVLVSSWSRPQDKKIIGYMKKTMHSTLPPLPHAFNPTTFPRMSLSNVHVYQLTIWNVRQSLISNPFELICVALWTRFIYGMSPCYLSP